MSFPIKVSSTLLTQIFGRWFPDPDGPEWKGPGGPRIRNRFAELAELMLNPQPLPPGDPEVVLGVRNLIDKAVDRVELAGIIVVGGDVQIERGREQLELADELLTEAEEAAVAAGTQRLLAAIWTNRATVARRQGRFADGRLLAEEALRSYTELEYVDGQLDGVEGVAVALTGLGDLAAGLMFLEVSGRERDATATYTFVPDEVAERDAAEKLARETLGSAESRACRELARELGFDELVTQLLGK